MLGEENTMSNLFAELLGIDLPEIEVKKETKKGVVKKASSGKSSKPAEKKEEKLTFPLTVLTGIRQPIVLSKEQAGDADTLEKVADFTCKQNGIPRYLTIAKRLSDGKIAVVLDRGKVQVKGEFDITEVSVVLVGSEELSLHEIVGKRTAKEINNFISKQTGEDVPYQFIADKSKLYAVIGESVAVGKVSLPVTIKSPLGDMVLTAADFDESDIEDNEVELFEVEEKVFSSDTHKELGPILALCRPSEPKESNILYVGDKLLTRDIPKSTTPTKTMYPTTAVISMLFNRIQLTPEMFGGRKEVEEKDIVAFLAQDYPEFTPARTRLTYDKEGNYIFPALKSSSKGADMFGSREECLATAEQNPVYFLGNYMEDGTEVRYEKTPVSVVEASADGSVGRFQWKLPKIPRQILNAVRDFFEMVSDEHEVEALVQIQFDPYQKEYRIRMPEQFVAKATVDTNDIPMSTPDMYYVMDIHSHNTMSAFFSHIDDRDEKANRVYGVMGAFGMEEPEMKFRAATGGKFVTISPSDVFEEVEDGEEYVVVRELYDEWRCNATIKKVKEASTVSNELGHGKKNMETMFFRSREDCVSAAEDYTDYFSGIYQNGESEVRYEKTPSYIIEVPMDESDEVKFQWRLPKIPRNIMNAVEELLFPLVHAEYGVETMVTVQYDAEADEYYLLVPAQNVTETSVDVLDMQELLDDGYNVLHMYLQNGVKEDCDYSGECGKIYGILNSCNNDEPEGMTFKVTIGGRSVALDRTVFVEDLEEDSEEVDPFELDYVWCSVAQRLENSDDEVVPRSMWDFPEEDGEFSCERCANEKRCAEKGKICSNKPDINSSEMQQPDSFPSMVRGQTDSQESVGCYFVIDRTRQIITGDFIRDPKRDYFPRFDTFDEASRWQKRGFYDDSDVGIFYKTSDGTFLRVIASL